MGWGYSGHVKGWEFTRAPIAPQDAIAPRRTAKATTAAVLDQNPQKLEELLGKGEGRATLRLKKDGQAVVEQVVSCFTQPVQLPNQLLIVS